jgi:anti-anti-sigma factor
MKISSQDYNDVTVVELQGDVDGDLAEVLKNIITSTIARSRTCIVLDMCNVAFIDSQGLEVLIWVRDYCKQNKTQLRLAGLDENCEKIFEITRLENEFDRYAELTEAVKSFA